MSNQDSTNSTTESTMLKGALVPTIIVGIACVALFSVLEGVHGFYGALVAQVVVVIFFLVHLVISKLSRNLDPIATMAFAMFSYFAKVMVVGAFLLILTKFTSREVIDRTSFGITAIVLTASKQPSSKKESLRCAVIGKKMPSGQSLDISYLDFFSGAESAGLEIAGSELPISPW